MKFITNIKERIAKKKDITITQQNIEESREEILAKGKKFKYPFQYAKHRLVINTIAIALVALITFTIIGWVQLYKAQNTSEVMYRFTKVLGLPVAEIDGEKVLFSDYLMIYRASVQSMEYQQGAYDDSEDSQSQKLFYKRQALDDAEKYTYALKVLRENNQTVSTSEIDSKIEELKMIYGEKRSDEAFEGIVRNNFGLSMSEYRRWIMLSIAKKKAAILLDKEAEEISEEIEIALKANGNSFGKVAKLMEDKVTVSYEDASDEVEVTNLDDGRAEMAMKLKKVGDVSSRFVSKNGDCYYYVRLVSKSDDGYVSYETLQIRFTALDDAISKLREEGKITEKIEIKTEDDSADESVEETGEEVEAPKEEQN